jgi:hypothetical protein
MGRTRYVLERHAYAPEQNRLHVFNRSVRKGSWLAPGCHTLDAAKRFVGLFPVRHFRWAEVRTEYPEPYTWLNKVAVAGRYVGPKDLPVVLRECRAKYCSPNNRGVVDGSTLPIPRLVAKVRLVAV